MTGPTTGPTIGKAPSTPGPPLRAPIGVSTVVAPPPLFTKESLSSLNRIVSGGRPFAGLAAASVMGPLHPPIPGWAREIRLSVLSGRRKEKELPFPLDDDGRLTIGGDPQAPSLFDKLGLGRHAEIFYQSGSFWIRDLGSFDGTFVNGNRLEPEVRCPIVRGDKIRLGKIFPKRIEVLLPEPPPLERLRGRIASSTSLDQLATLLRGNGMAELGGQIDRYLEVGADLSGIPEEGGLGAKVLELTMEREFHRLHGRYLEGLRGVTARSVFEALSESVEKAASVEELAKALSTSFVPACLSMAHAIDRPEDLPELCGIRAKTRFLEEEGRRGDIRRLEGRLKETSDGAKELLGQLIARLKELEEAGVSRGLLERELRAVEVRQREGQERAEGRIAWLEGELRRAEGSYEGLRRSGERVPELERQLELTEQARDALMNRYGEELASGHQRFTEMSQRAAKAEEEVARLTGELEQARGELRKEREGETAKQWGRFEFLSQGLAKARERAEGLQGELEEARRSLEGLAALQAELVGAHQAFAESERKGVEASGRAEGLQKELDRERHASVQARRDLEGMKRQLDDSILARKEKIESLSARLWEILNESRPGEGEKTPLVLERGKGVRLDPAHPYLVGRGPSSHIYIEERHISRIHFEVRRVRERWEIKDLSGTSKTRVNGETVGAEWLNLQDGDEIGLGHKADETLLVFQTEKENGAASLLFPEALPVWRVVSDPIAVREFSEKYQGSIEILFGEDQVKIASAFRNLFANFPDLEEAFNPNAFFEAITEGRGRYLFSLLEAVIRRHLSPESGELLTDSFRRALEGDFKTIKQREGVFDIHIVLTPAMALEKQAAKRFVTVGSDRGCDVVIKHDSVSPRHLLFGFQENRDTWVVKDEEGSQGTHLNRMPIEKSKWVPLNQGDLLRVGGVELRVSFGSDGSLLVDQPPSILP